MMETRETDKQEEDIRDGCLVRVVRREEKDYRDEMLRNNKITGLLPVFIQEYNEKHEYWYELGGKDSLREYYKKNKPNTEMICGLMRQIEATAETLSGFLLEQDDLVLDFGTIFVYEQQYYFVYQPGYAKPMRSQIEMLLSDLMEYMDYEDRASVSLVYLLHARVRQETGLSLSQLCSRILGEERRLCEDAVEDITGVVRESTDYMYCGNKSVQSQKERKTDKKEVKKEGSRRFAKLPGIFQNALRKFSESTEPLISVGETIPLELYEREELCETVPLEIYEKKYCLEPLEDEREKIEIFCFPFLLGKENGGAGYCFQEAVISRRHAEMKKEGNQIFLVDCGSKNGTSVNGRKLLPQEMCRLQKGDIIGFAGIFFIFQF